MQGAGYTLRDQQREVKITDGDITLYGHIDGIIEGLAESKKPHLWECKSASDKEWKRCAKVGYGAWNEKYKAQIHVYMLLLELTRALVWVENKNTSEVHTERINVDRGYAIKTLEKCFAAIQSDTAPDRSCPSAAWYEAKFCKYREVCFG